MANKNTKQVSFGAVDVALAERVSALCADGTTKQALLRRMLDLAEDDVKDEGVPEFREARRAFRRQLAEAQKTFEGALDVACGMVADAKRRETRSVEEKVQATGELAAAVRRAEDAEARVEGLAAQVKELEGRLAEAVARAEAIEQVVKLVKDSGGSGEEKPKPATTRRRRTTKAKSAEKAEA